jgi:hypothetical protein
MKKLALFVLVAAALFCAVSPGLSEAAPIDQWASSVIGYSSQYRSDLWSAAQATGAPDTSTYADNTTAWAPLPQNGAAEYITLGYTTPIYATGALIRQTWGNGFVTKIELVDNSNGLHTVWTGTDPSQPGSPVDFTTSWAITNYLVKGIKITIDPNHNMATWEEIDAVRLSGNTAPVPIPPAVWLLGSGLVGMAGLRWRHRSKK